jgi:hypothetical protein
VQQFRKLVSPLDATILAIENGEDRNPETLALLGPLGMLSGFTDLALVMTRARIHFIEVKLEATLRHPRSELREDQRAIHRLLAYYDHKVSVVRSAAEFWHIVDSHGITHGALPQFHEQLLLPRPRRRPTRAKITERG